MSDFKPSNDILIQPNDIRTVKFKVTSCSSVELNDGFLGFNQSISSATIVILDKDSEDVTDELLVEPVAVMSNILNVRLQYPSSGSGRYKVTFILNIDNGDTREIEGPKINCMDV